MGGKTASRDKGITKSRWQIWQRENIAAVGEAAAARLLGTSLWVDPQDWTDPQPKLPAPAPEQQDSGHPGISFFFFF